MYSQASGRGVIVIFVFGELSPLKHLVRIENLIGHYEDMDSFNVAEVPGKGLSMISLKIFKPGDTIFEEEPLVSRQFCWNADYGYAACDHCMRPLETTLDNVRRLTNDGTVTIPYEQYCHTSKWVPQFTKCQGCEVRYCSEDCRFEAWNTYHKYECLQQYRFNPNHPLNILRETWKRMHYPPETGTVMLIGRLMSLYEQSTDRAQTFEKIKSFHNRTVNDETNIGHKMLGPNFQQQMDVLYQAFINAYSSETFEVFRTREAFQTLMAIIGTNSQGVATSPLATWVQTVSELTLPPPEKAFLDNCIDSIYSKVAEHVGEFMNAEGVGLYILGSKINHSCVPNAESSFPYSNHIMMLKAIRPIKPGEEIQISYLDECQLRRSRHSRQKVLSDHYIFRCECVKCQEQANDPDVTSDEDMECDQDQENDDMM